MKNYKKSLLQSTFILVIFIGISSCMNKKTEVTKKVAEEKNEQKFDNNNEKDAQFLVDATDINREEISLGQLAQEKGSSNHVKELGEMMEDEHSKLLDALIVLAQTKNISTPTSLSENGTEAYNRLDKKSGNDFGLEYSQMMIDGHRKAIELFEKASTDCNDPDIRTWAKATLPALRKHLDQSLLCKKKCEKM